MSFKTITSVLASAVATNGTFAVTYPTGTSKGSFIGGHKHKLVALQNEFTAPTGFTVSFGATTATVTWLGTTTIPANSTVFLQLDMPGANNFLDTAQVNDGLQQVVKVSPRLLNLGSPLTSSTTALLNGCTTTNMPLTTVSSITYTFATTGGTAPLNGANTTGVLDVPRNLVVTVTHASSVHALTVEVTSLDVAGQSMIEDFVVAEGATSVTVNGVKAHSKVQTIKISTTATSVNQTLATVNVGFGNVLGLPEYVADAQVIMEELFNNAAISGRGDTVALPFVSSLALGPPLVVSPVAGRLSKVVVGTQQTCTLGTFTTQINATVVAGLAGTINPTISNLTTAPLASVTPTNPQGVSTVVAVGDIVQVIPATCNQSSGAIFGFVEIQPTKSIQGTLTVGNSTTTQSATSGDPRGTYAPATACDGTNSYGLLCLLPDNQSSGVAQWNTANALA